MDFKLKTQYAGGEPTLYLSKASDTVIPAGSFVALSSGLAILAVSASTKLAYSPLGAPAGVTLVPILDDYQAEFIGDADAAFAVTDRGAEVDLRFRDAVFTTGVAEDTAATWEVIEDGSFSIVIDGTSYNVDGLTFDTLTTMDQVAAAIEDGIQAATSGTETVVWDDTNKKFIISSTAQGLTSEVNTLGTSTGTVGTDISVEALMNGPAGVEVSYAQVIDLGSSSTDVLHVDVGDDAGTVDSASDIVVKINQAKYLY